MPINSFPISTRTVDIQKILDAEGYATQAELAALAAGAPIVTTLTSPVPANGTVELLKVDAGLQVHEVVSGAWVFRGWLVGPEFENVSTLIASPSTFADGTIIRTREEGFAYRVDSTATVGFIENSATAAQRFVSLDQLSQQEATGINALEEKPAIALSTVVDIFIAYGQSNAAGGYSGGTADRYDVPSDYGYLWNISDGTLDPLADPTRADGQDKASAWPAFASEWARITGRPAVIVNAAIGGAVVAELEPGATPDHYQDMEDATAACIAHLNANGYEINSCSMIWSQGETDAAVGSLTNTQYIAALANIHITLFTAISEYANLYISKTGMNWDGGDYSAWAEYLQRTIMREALNRTYWHVCFTEANRFNRSNGLLSDTDFVHYSQMGYNLMGLEIARNIVEERMYGTATGRLIMQDELSQVFQPYEANNGDGNTESRDHARLARQDSTIPFKTPIRWLNQGIDIHGDTGLIDDNGNVRVKVTNTGQVELRSADGAFKVQVDDTGIHWMADDGAGGFNKRLTLKPDEDLILSSPDGQESLAYSAAGGVFRSGGSAVMILNNSGGIRMLNLPTANPSTSNGTIWNDSGTLKIS